MSELERKLADRRLVNLTRMENALWLRASGNDGTSNRLSLEIHLKLLDSVLGES